MLLLMLPRCSARSWREMIASHWLTGDVLGGPNKIHFRTPPASRVAPVSLKAPYASTFPSASSRSAQYCFVRVDAALSGSFPCWIWTWAFDTPLRVKPSWTAVLSGQVIRMDLLRVAGAGAGAGACFLLRSCARAVVYASPVFRMRARTRRLKSLLVGIVSVLWSGHRRTPPSSVTPRRPKGLLDADPGVCPPLPHGDPRWGRIDEVGRGPPPGIHHASSGPGWQDPRAPGRRAPSD